MPRSRDPRRAALPAGSAPRPPSPVRRPGPLRRLGPLAAALALLTAPLGCDGCRTNLAFRGLQINEVRYSPAELPVEERPGDFVELRGPAGMELSGLLLHLFEGDRLVARAELPDGTIIPASGLLLLSDRQEVLDADGETVRPVDVRLELRDVTDGEDGTQADDGAPPADTEPGEGPRAFLPSAPDSGVTLVWPDPSRPGAPFEVVDSVRYRPSGRPLAMGEAPFPAGTIRSWWQSEVPAAQGLGEGAPAPALPRRERGDPVWGLSRIGERDSDDNARDFLVASVTPGRVNEALWARGGQDGGTVSALLRPVINEVVATTRAAGDEGSFVELRGKAGLEWEAGPGHWVLQVILGDPDEGPARIHHRLPLKGAIPASGLFLAADSPALPSLWTGRPPDQQVRCEDLRWERPCTRLWNWLPDEPGTTLQLEYRTDDLHRVVVDRVRWNPASPGANRAVEEREDRATAAVTDRPPVARLPTLGVATSLARIGRDTHVDARDFVTTEPTPGRRNTPPPIDRPLTHRAAFGQPVERSPGRGDGTEGADLGAAPLGTTNRVLFDSSVPAGPSAADAPDAGHYRDWINQLRRRGASVILLEETGSGRLDDGALDGVQALVIAAPRRRYRTSEAEALARFLERGGHLLFMPGTDPRAWNLDLGLAELTGVAWSDERVDGELVLLEADAEAIDHPALVGVAGAACNPLAGPPCTFGESSLYRPPGVEAVGPRFLGRFEEVPEGVSVTPLLRGQRPRLTRAPGRLDAPESTEGAVEGGTEEVYAAAILLPTGSRVLAFGDPEAFVSGGPDPLSWAQARRLHPYGTTRRNALFAINGLRWLLGQPAISGTQLPPVLVPVPAPEDGDEPAASQRTSGDG